MIFRGYVSMFVQLFGKYLIENKILSPTILKQIIDKQKTVRVKLGTIAIAEGYMTEEQVTEINEIQKREDKRFGDVAIEMGLLTDEKLKILLSKQGDAYMQFVELLTEMTGLSNRDIEEFLKAYKKDAGFSDAEMEALKSDDMDALMPLFIFSKKPYVIDIAGLILRNFVRFISSDFYIEKVKHLKELPYSHLSVQELAGDHSVFIGIAAEEDSEAFLKIGNSFAHDEKTDVVVDTYDSVSEFINVTGGIFASELSKKGTDIDMEPPLSFKDQKAAGDFYVVPVYLEGKKVDIVISVDSEFTAGDTPVNTGAVIAHNVYAANAGDGAKALVVDDSRMSRVMLCNILEKAGLNVVAEAANGIDAVQAYKEHKPDIVTMDITMPQMDGLEALAKILEFDPAAKVVMLSAAGQQDKLIKALKTGAKRFISKPFNEDEIINNIKEIL